MPRGSSPKRERQYEHIKDSAEQRGESTERAEEIAARRGNKERAGSGEAKTASRTSKQDISSSRRGGLRSHSGPGGPTYEQLYSEARRRNIKGRSSMNKAQLARALGRCPARQRSHRTAASNWRDQNRSLPHREKTCAARFAVPAKTSFSSFRSIRLGACAGV